MTSDSNLICFDYDLSGTTENVSFGIRDASMHDKLIQRMKIFNLTYAIVIKLMSTYSIFSQNSSIF